jgi:hypothetical protein
LQQVVIMLPKPGTGTDPDTVGQSTGSHGEDKSKTHKESGRHDEGTQGQSQRPVGGSSGRDVSGVAPSKKGPSPDPDE